jgi:hypothetical protein
MAVTIDEMHVDVQQAAPTANAPAANTEAKKEVDLREALQVLHERRLRVRAD